MMPNITLNTIAINEMEWLSYLYDQHKDWPGMTRWVFVEFADEVYARSNPNMVSKDGLSVDGTTEFLEKLAREDDRVVHVKLGMVSHPKLDQGKIVAKNQLLQESAKVRPDYVIILDADEMYTKAHQAQLSWCLVEHRANAYVFRRREIWRPPSISDQPLFKWEVVGGFWSIPCCHWWRFYPGMQFVENHNTPSHNGNLMIKLRSKRLDGPDDPQLIHLGFAAKEETRRAKADYYKARGEGTTDSRQWYVASRESWFDWTPGKRLMRGAQVIPYRLPIPEAFQEGEG